MDAEVAVLTEYPDGSCLTVRRAEDPRPLEYMLSELQEAALFAALARRHWYRAAAKARPAEKEG